MRVGFSVDFSGNFSGREGEAGRNKESIDEECAGYRISTFDFPERRRLITLKVDFAFEIMIN